MAVFLLYWVAVGILLLIGFIQLIVKAVNDQPLKPALRLLIIGVILLVVGAGACVAILSNLSIH
ncbi:hypothetical protein [Pedobacter africanus]|uniref:Uncharacterized protein n=1 Tax=Pedobacter africanus TaxID=151894 RepID=A0A1W2E9H4_9SPHI|nr:hypothetical protein [Pedobacter africanus]SMD06430.1 hypothetical protein SAMN04488524_4603 [Pedobacter africanus]